MSHATQHRCGEPIADVLPAGTYDAAVGPFEQPIGDLLAAH